MASEAELTDSATNTVVQLLEALRDGDAARYRALMSDSDQQYMTEEVLSENMASMRESTGPLLSFKVEGMVLHAAAGHAAAHVTLEFEKTTPQSELYNLTLQATGWRLDFDFAELMGLGF